jgi:carboxypeptidase C (cathepsin A)
MKKNIVLVILMNAATLLFSSWNKLSDLYTQSALKFKSAGNNSLANTGNQLAVTQHQLNVNGLHINYTATAGYMPITNKEQKPIAKIFYVAYQSASKLNGTKRPVTFVFNGGPGSASIWLHMGSFGPVRVKFKNDKGDAPAAPYQYEDNPYTWLGFTDLVFIDPVSTGYSRAEEGTDPKNFQGYQEDISSVGEFIRLYIAKNNRWDSPKYIAGESYGTVRAVGLAGYLQSHDNIYLNGITLISSALNYQLLKFNRGNDMPYIYYLPSYAVTAQYHHKLSPGLQNMSADELVKRATSFAKKTYAYYLAEGDAASPSLTNSVIDSLHYFTGLPKDYLISVNGKVSDRQFFKKLLGTTDQVVGAFDGRFAGNNLDDNDQNSYYDPSEANLTGLFVSAFNSYITKELKYQNDLPYQATADLSSWNNKPVINNGFLDVSESLKTSMTKNPHLKINMVCGYYDLSTPVASTAYVIDHLGLKPDLRKNISMNYYAAGHMVYISKEADNKLKNDGEIFYRQSVNN